MYNFICVFSYLCSSRCHEQLRRYIYIYIYRPVTFMISLEQAFVTSTSRLWHLCVPVDVSFNLMFLIKLAIQSSTGGVDVSPSGGFQAQSHRMRTNSHNIHNIQQKRKPIPTRPMQHQPWTGTDPSCSERPWYIYVYNCTYLYNCIYYYIIISRPIGSRTTWNPLRQGGGRSSPHTLTPSSAHGPLWILIPKRI